MKSTSIYTKKWILACVSIFTIILLGFVGCSNSNNLSNSSRDGDAWGDLWDPAPGFELEPGRPIPRLNDDYWEDGEGSHTNPWRRGNLSATPIDDDGGTVRLGLHFYVIPAGAVDSPTNFTMTYASLGAVAVDCGPSPFEFNLPVILTLSYDNTSYEEDGVDPSDLRIWYANPDGSFEPLESTVDQITRTVSASVDHFSRYILG